MGATIPARGSGAQYAAERILLVYFAAELRILLVYLSESLGRLGQNGRRRATGGHIFHRGPRPPGLPIEPPLMLSYTLKDVEPVRLPVVFGNENAGVQQHQDDDEPVEPLGLDRLTTNFAASLITRQNTLPELSNHR